MDTQRIKVLRGNQNQTSRCVTLPTYLHVADSNAVVAAVAHDLVLDLLPALHALLDQDLRAGRERLSAERTQLRFVLRKAGPEAT